MARTPPRLPQSVLTPETAYPNPRGTVNRDQFDMAIIYGTNWSEYIDGTNNSDVIFGYGGNDVIFGYSGNDDIYGGAGNDVIDGVWHV